MCAQVCACACANVRVCMFFCYLRTDEMYVYLNIYTRARVLTKS